MEGFAKKLIRYIKGCEEIEEIPRHQRFVGRPCLKTLFNKKTGTKRRERNVKIVESIEKHSHVDILCQALFSLLEKKS